MNRSFLVLMMCMLLAACTTMRPPPSGIPSEMLAKWGERQEILDAIDHWDMKGRMAVRTAEDGGSATFIWERLGEQHRIEMFGPFGSGRVSIIQDEHGALLRDGDNPPLEADSAESLLYLQVGWHVPFESLRYWLKGIPSPEAHEGLLLDARGRALGFRQGGWDVSILDYDSSQPLELPRRVFIQALPGTVHLIGERGEDLGDQLDVRVVLQRWQVLEPGERI